MTGRSQEQCTAWNSPPLTAHWWPIVSNWKLTSSTNHQGASSPPQLQISSHSLLSFVICETQPRTGDWRKSTFWVNQMPQTVRKNWISRQWWNYPFWWSASSEWCLFLEGQKPGPYFQIIFNNFSLESIFYEFLTDTNIHCRNES